MVRKTSPHVVSMELGFLEQGGDVVVVQSILDLVARASLASYQAPLPEQSKLVRNGRLACSRDDGEIPNTKWAG